MSTLRTRALLGAALTTSAIVAVPSAAATASTVPAGGNLNLELTGGAAASLERQKVTVSATAPAKRSDDVLTTPAATVKNGRDKVLTTNSGSITFKKGSRTVSFSTISTHLGNRIRIRASIDGETKTVLTANRKKTRVTFDQAGNSELHATRLRLTTAGAREIREGLKLKRLGRGTLTKVYGKFNPERAATPPSPQPTPVATPGKLVWTQVNVFDRTAPANTDRTWLGYVTNGAMPGFPAQGTFTPSDGAVGDSVTPTSERGADKRYTTTFPMTSSSANAAAKTGSIRYAGLVTWKSEAHGFTIAIQNPRIEFNGTNTAQFFATGLRTAGGVGGGPSTVEPFDESQPVFTLDLSGSGLVANADNTTTITNAAPTVVATGYTFPTHPDYGAGAGPTRTPNTFGTFDITVPNVQSP